MNVWKRIKRYFKLNTMPNEYTSDYYMNRYIPDVVFDRDVMLYIVKYKPKYDSYTSIVQQYNQGFDV